MNGKYDKGAKQRELSSSWLKSKHWTSETNFVYELFCLIHYNVQILAK